MRKTYTCERTGYEIPIQWHMKRWHYILLTIALCAMSFSYGHSLQTCPVQASTFVTEKVYVPVYPILPVKLKPVRVSELMATRKR